MLTRIVVAATLAFCVSLVPAEEEAAASLEEGYVSLFNGKDLAGWNLKRVADPGYQVQDGILICPQTGGGHLFTEKQYSDFSFRFEFKLRKASNNGVGIRCPLNGAPAYDGMEIQIIDNVGYPGKLESWQHHGSIYNVVPAKMGALKPVGEWNKEEIICQGPRIKVIVNNQVIVDADLSEVTDEETIKKHPGIKRTTGHVGFLGHNSYVEFRNIRVKEFSTEAKSSDTAADTK